MKNFKKYLLERLKEPSTWYGIMQILSVFGFLHLTDSQDIAVRNLINIILGVGVTSIIAPDKWTK